MPFYEYKCTDCGTEFVKLVKNESETILCTRCFGKSVIPLAHQKDSRHDAGAGSCPCTACKSSNKG